MRKTVSKQLRRMAKEIAMTTWFKGNQGKYGERSMWRPIYQQLKRDYVRRNHP